MRAPGRPRPPAGTSSTLGGKRRVEEGTILLFHILMVSALAHRISRYTSLVAQWKRTCLPMQETWVRSLGQEEPLEEEMVTHSSILSWVLGNSMTEEPGGLQSMGFQKSWT